MDHGDSRAERILSIGVDDSKAVIFEMGDVSRLAAAIRPYLTE
jgi:hypothetical protein